MKSFGRKVGKEGIMNLINIEFYSTPDGEVMIKESNSPVRLLQENDREVVQELFMIIRDRYPDAFSHLSELYSKSERNRVHFEYKIVHRFIRCNFGEYDQQNFDINHNGVFQFEEVKCPLRGECKHEGNICKAKLNTKLTIREKEVLKLISDGYKSNDIANELSLSITTVSRHRENIKAKLCLRTTAQMVEYYVTNLRR